jgi:glycosyltransferase involved in cell wall biosynthesis
MNAAQTTSSLSGGIRHRADILMTADTIGGVWNYCIELARALEPFDSRIVLATMGARMTDSQRNEAAALRNIELRESEFRLEWMNDPWDDVTRAGEWLLGLESEWRPKIIHLNGFTHASLDWRAPIIVVAHSCVLSWWRTVHGSDAPAEWAHYAAAVARGLAAAHAVVAPSRAMLKSIRELYGEPRRSCVIHNGRRSTVFTVGPKADYVLAVGRGWDAAKNFIRLADIAASLPWKLYLAGPLSESGASVQHLPNLITLGNLAFEELRDWLAAAPVLVHPAKYEPFGLAPLEAALSGCALVLGDIPSLREIWSDAAIFVPPDDAGTLRDSVSLLMSDPAIRAELGEKAYRRGLSFSPERMAASYMRLYRELLSHN